MRSAFEMPGLRRLAAMIVKEIWAVLRDPRARFVLIGPPLLQLFVFSYATTLDVRNADVGVLNLSEGVHSNELIAQIAGSRNFRRIVPLASTTALRQAIDDQQVIAALVIDADFDRRISAGTSARLGLVLDGRRSNAAQIVSGYISQIAASVGAETLPRASAEPGSVITNWYNPSLDYIWFTLPSLITIIVSVAGLAVT